MVAPRDAVSQLAPVLVETVAARVKGPPVLAMGRVCAGGAMPFTSALKAAVAVDRLSKGWR